MCGLLDLHVKVFVCSIFFQLSAIGQVRSRPMARLLSMQSALLQFPVSNHPPSSSPTTSVEVFLSFSSLHSSPSSTDSSQQKIFSQRVTNPLPLCLSLIVVIIDLLSVALAHSRNISVFLFAAKIKGEFKTTKHFRYIRMFWTG